MDAQPLIQHSLIELFLFHFLSPANMFGGGSVNPYDEIVGEYETIKKLFKMIIDCLDIGKTTDENLTSENWELILNLCDKVSDEGQEGSISP